ncbi:MAG: hypothetical protein WBO18_19440 [Gammaproteobacteria bacterium]
MILFLWSLFGAFLIFFSGRSLFRKITLPIFLFLYILNIGFFNIANSPLDFQQAIVIVENFRWWFWAVVENYGLAAASSNCSDYSNLILRTGVRKEKIPDHDQMTLKKPSIWQFTREAGFYNVYLDAQSAEETTDYQNLMNEHEASFLDEVIRVRQKIAYNSDGVAGEKLMDHLKQPGKTFIILNKYGLHFPTLGAIRKSTISSALLLRMVSQCMIEKNR